MKQAMIEERLAALPQGAAPRADLLAGLLESIDNPERTVQMIPVVGKNGKSTAVNAIAAVLAEAEFQVGSYVWQGGCVPLYERIRLNGKPMLQRLFELCVETVLAAVSSEFDRNAAEIAVAALAFSAMKCNYAVVELEMPELGEAFHGIPVCVVTNAGLGEDRKPDTAFAARVGKAFRPDCTGIVYPGAEKQILSELVVAAAAQKDCMLEVIDGEDLAVQPMGEDGQPIDYGGYDVKLQVLGRAGAEAAAIAAGTALYLWRLGVEITDDAILVGLENFRSQFALHAIAPGILADVCDTPERCVHLMKTLEAAGYENIHLIFAPDREADVDALCTALENGSWTAEDKSDKNKMAGMSESGIEMVYPVAHSGENAADPLTVQKTARFHFDAIWADSLEDALEAAKEAEADCTVICGSRQIVLDAEKLFKK